MALVVLCALPGLTAALTSPARAGVTAADPIDFQMRACLARADRSSTAGQLQCMNEARQSWRMVMRQAYGQLLARLPHGQRGRWIISQHRWNAWYRAENPLLATVFSTADKDAMSAQSEADIRLQTVRDRALLLRTQSARAAMTGHRRRSLPYPVRPCQANRRCARASREMNRYYHYLLARLPAYTRVTLAHAQYAWRAYRDATTPLINANARIDLTGARLATLKRLSDTVGYR